MANRNIIDLSGMAQLLGVTKNTVNQWRQRSRKGEMNPPLPDQIPDLEHPAWDEQPVLDWAIATGRWPPGSTARPMTRKVPKKATKRATKTSVITAKKVTKTATKTAVKATKTPDGTTKKASPPKRAIPPVTFRPPPEEPEDRRRSKS